MLGKRGSCSLDGLCAVELIPAAATAVQSEGSGKGQWSEKEPPLTGLGWQGIGAWSTGLFGFTSPLCEQDGFFRRGGMEESWSSTSTVLRYEEQREVRAGQ